MQLKDSLGNLLEERRQKITISAVTAWQELTADFVAKKEGEVTVFIDNQDTEPVYFDELELRVERTPTLVITQEHHYYPFGMNMSGIERDGELKYQFNGMVEKEEAFGLELYETPFRSYDAQLGRFWQVEPLADEFHSISMFQFAFNNPISANDPTGLSPNVGQHHAWMTRSRMKPNYSYNWNTGNYYNNGKQVSWEEVNGYLQSSGQLRELVGKNIYSYSQYELGGDGDATPIAHSTLHVTTVYNLSEKSFSFSAWERDLSNSFRNFGSKIEDMFGDGQNMQGFAEGVAGLNPLVSAANVYTGYMYGENIFGEKQGKWGTAGELASIIPGEGLAVKGTAYLGKGMMAAAPLLVRNLKGSHSVYHGFKNGALVYVGRTKDLARRMREHGDRFDDIKPVFSDISRSVAKGLEQIEISKFGLNNLENKINAIGINNKKISQYYRDAVSFLTQ